MVQAKECRDFFPRESAAAEHKFQRFALPDLGAEGAKILFEAVDAADAGGKPRGIAVREIGIAEVKGL